MTTLDDLKLIEAVLKRARRLGLAYRYGGMKDLAADAKDALDALDAVARVHSDIRGRQLELWEKEGESNAI